MKRFVLTLLLVAAAAVPVNAQVHVQIGVQLPAPPPFVVIPGMPVYYAPQAPANVFFYAHQYWGFVDDGWYVGPSWNGPWRAVPPVAVPAPILHVPVRYYPAPPQPWRAWRGDRPPQWEPHYGREWHEEDHERNWRVREERWAHGERNGCPPAGPLLIRGRVNDRVVAQDCQSCAAHTREAVGTLRASSGGLLKL